MTRKARGRLKLVISSFRDIGILFMKIIYWPISFRTSRNQVNYTGDKVQYHTMRSLYLTLLLLVSLCCRLSDAIFCYVCESVRDFRCLDPFDYQPFVQVGLDSFILSNIFRHIKIFFCRSTAARCRLCGTRCRCSARRGPKYSTAST